MRDTTAATEQVRLAAIRQMDPSARMHQAFDLSEWMRALALSHLRAVHPDWTERQLVAQLFANVNGHPIATRS